jgi:hypothetical protein
MASGWPGVARGTTEQILEAASRLRHPEDLVCEESIAMMLRQRQSEVEEWPSMAPGSPELSVAIDLQSGTPLDKVHLIVLPTDDWTTIPAYLRWGGWNDCPAPENHVAALRSWRDRFGAELVGLSPDVMNIKVEKSRNRGPPRSIWPASSSSIAATSSNKALVPSARLPPH